MDKFVTCPSTNCGMTRIRYYECKKDANKEFDEINNHIEGLGIQLLNPDWSIDFTYYKLNIPTCPQAMEIENQETKGLKIKENLEDGTFASMKQPVNEDEEDQVKIMKKIKRTLANNTLRVSEKTKKDDLYLYLNKGAKGKVIKICLRIKKPRTNYKASGINAEIKDADSLDNYIISNIELPKNFIEFSELTPAFEKCKKRYTISVRGKEYILGDHIIRFGMFDKGKKNHILYEVEYRPLVYMKENNNKIHYKEFFDCIWEFLFGDSKMPIFYKEFLKKNLDLTNFAHFNLDQYIWSKKHTYVQMLVCLTSLLEK